MVILNILICILIVAILAAGAYFAAYRVVMLIHQRNTLTDEIKRATEHIAELEARIDLLEAERDAREARLSRLKDDTSGWDAFEVRV